jgi:ankyrin repeat protein
MASGDEDSSYEDEFNLESNAGSRRYPVHDCCEFEDAETLKSLIFVREQSSDDNGEKESSEGSSSEEDHSGDEVDPEHEANAAAAAAMGHSPAPLPSNRLHLRASPTDGDGDDQGDKKVEGADAKGISDSNNVITVGEVSNDAAKEENVEDGKISKKEKKRRRKRSFYCPYDLDERDYDENTPLHLAIHACKVECVKLLLQGGASVHKKCDGSAPVHTAISMGSIPAHSRFTTDCMSELISSGVDLTVKDESLHTPLYLAAMYNLPECASLILENASGMTTLNMRADRSGGRALHASAKFDTKKHITKAVAGAIRPPDQSSAGTLTRMLLSTPGIEVDPVNSYGRTPLHVAASKGNWPVVRLLLQFGANPSAADQRGLTPGQYAAKRGMTIPNDLVPHLGNGSDPYTGQKRDSVLDPNANTILLCHEMCGRHKSCPPINRGAVDDGDPPPENVRRLHVLINEDSGILHSEEFHGCSWEKEARRAAMADVLKVSLISTKVSQSI